MKTVMSKAYQKKKKGKTPLRYELHKSMAKEEPGRSYRVVHASDVTNPMKKFCPRENVLKRLEKVPTPTEFVTTSERVVFDHGNAWNQRIAHYFVGAGKHPRGMTIGDWICPACNKEFKFQRRPMHCNECGIPGKLLTYEEVRVVSQYSGISCGLDLLLDVGEESLLLVENKTLEKNEFKNLSKPSAEHLTRTQLYMRCLSEAEQTEVVKSINPNRSVILYSVKGGYGFIDNDLKKQSFQDGPYSPFKEFEITRDDESLDNMVESARLVELFKKEGKIPLGVCVNSFDKRAKSCPMFDACFSTKYPPTGE